MGESLSAHEVLVRARNLIERDGHKQFGYGWPGAPKCAQGGVLEACDLLGSSGLPLGGRQDYGLVREADLALGEAIGPVRCRDTPPAALDLDSEWSEAVTRIVTFNNAYGRTKLEVLDVFDTAILVTAPEPCDPLQGVVVGEAEGVAHFQERVDA